MEIKKTLFFASVLALLLFSTTGSAEEWELTFEDHPYDIGSFAEVVTGDSSIQFQDNTHQLYMYGSAFGVGNKDYNHVYIHHGFDSDIYFSFKESASAQSRIALFFYDKYGTLLGSTNYYGTSSFGSSRIHVSNDDGIITLYLNNDVLGTASISTTNPISYFRITGYVYYSSGGYSTYKYYIDDFSTSPYCIGHKGFVKPEDSTVYFTVNTPVIDDYSYYVQMCDPNGAEIKHWDVTSFRDTCNYTPATDLTDDGLYYLYIYGQDNKLYYSKPFLFTSGVVPADMIFKASGTVNADVRDSTNQGGEIESGGERYLYMTETEGGHYPINVTLLEEAFSFRYNHDLVYAMHDVKSSLVTFEGLQSNYKVTLDGETFPPGAAATGSFYFSGNLTDGDYLNISDDTYEFDNEGNISNNSIPVSLNESNLTISTGNLLSEIEKNGTADISAELTISEGAGGGDSSGPAGYNYTAEITITDPSDQEGYQAPFNISQLSGMQDDGEDIRFTAENGTDLNYWIDYDNSINGSYYIGYVATPASATVIKLFYGNDAATSESNGDAVFELFDDFSGSSLNSDKWTATGDTSELYISNSVMHFQGDGTDYITSKKSFGDGFVFEARRNIDHTGSQNSIIGFGQRVTDASSYAHEFDFSYSDNYACFNVGDGSNHYVKSIYTGDEWGWLTIEKTKTQCNFILVMDDGDSASETLSYTPPSDTPIVMGAAAYFSPRAFNMYVDHVRVRKYEETEPTLTVGTPEPVSTTTTATLSLTANTPGTAGNLISLSANATNITASGPFMAGGLDTIGYTNGATTWSYNITDWTSTEHIFEFTPDLTKPGIYGYVKDPDTQQPLRTATVTIFNDSASFLLWTDSNGMYYKTTDLTPGQRYSVKAAKNRYVTFERSATTKEGATTRYDLFLNREKGAGLYYAPHDVLFTVWEYWNSGAGLPGASYAVYEGEDAIKTGITDSEGSFVVEDMDTGTRYKIIITYNEQTYTEFYEPGASSYTIILNKENIIHEYYNNWLNLTYEESAGCVNVSYSSNEAIAQTSLIATASNGTTVYSETRTTDNGNFSFSYPEGDYRIIFTAVTDTGLTASQSWAVSYSADVDLFPSSYPAWLKNILFVGIILFFLLAFGKARNDIACGSAAVLTSIGYYFNWLVCSFNFVILIWLISLGAVFVHYKRTKGTG